MTKQKEENLEMCENSEFLSRLKEERGSATHLRMSRPYMNFYGTINLRDFSRDEN